MASSLAATGSSMPSKAEMWNWKLPWHIPSAIYATAVDAETLEIAKAIEADLLETFRTELVTDYMVSEENLATFIPIEEFEQSPWKSKGGVKSGSVAETRRLSISVPGGRRSA